MASSDRRRRPPARAFTPAVLVLALLAAHAATGAIARSLTRRDLGRAVGLARWPATGADRARFHAPYVAIVKSDPYDGWSVDRIELITEFRRAELMAEDHVRINDLWGRNSLADVEEAMRPYRDRVAIRAHLTVGLAGTWIGTVPDADVVVDEGRVEVHGMQRTPTYVACPGVVNCPLMGGTLDAWVDAAALDEPQAAVTIRWRGVDLAQVTFDLGAIE